VVSTFLAALLLGAAGPLAAQSVPTQVPAEPTPAPAQVQALPPAAPVLSRVEIEHFLETARIVRSRSVPKGVTAPVRLTLSNGTLEHDAVFSSVDERRPVMRFSSGRTEIDFVDSYRYSIAAYRLAVLLGLDDMMPVHVERTWNQQKGALSWWVEAKWDEGQRLKENLQAPDVEAWNRQMHRMRVFTQLVADTDRNLGNLLITADWKIWMIDFTRAFRRSKELLSSKDLARCDRKLLAALRSLTEEQVTDAIKKYVGRAEIAGVMARRDAIVALIEQRIAERGEAAVLY
jgi:hypothetical protein